MDDALIAAEKHTNELWGVLQKSICMRVKGKVVD